MSCNCYSLAYNCGNVVYMDCFGRRFFDIEVENLKYFGSNVCIGLFSEVLTFQTGHPSAVLSVPVDFLWVNRTQEFLSKHNLRTGYLYLAIFREAARGRWSQIWFRIPKFTTTILRNSDQSLKNWELQIMFESYKLFCVTSECYLSFKFVTAVTMVICTSFVRFYKHV